MLTLNLEGRDVVYALEGFLELTLRREGRGKSAALSASVWTVNVSGRLKSGPRRAPRRIHLRLAGTQTGSIAIDPRSGQGEGRVPVEIEYAELRGSRRHRLPPEGDSKEALLPVRVALSVSLHYDLARGGFRLAAGGIAADFPPLSAAPLTLGIVLACICDDKVPCLHVCLSVKVRRAGGAAGAAVQTRAQLDAMVAALNRIWACEPPGQCCIRFLISQFIEDPALPDHYANPGAIDAGWRAITARNRHGTCFDVYFIGTLNGISPTGSTVRSGDNSGSILSTTGRTPAQLAETLSHELGHALGMRAGSGTDDDGVDNHSNKPGNVMAGPSATPRSRLNEKQCRRARGSPWARAPLSPKACAMSPLE